MNTLKKVGVSSKSASENVYMNLVANNENMVNQNTAVKFDTISKSREGIMYIEEENAIMFISEGVYYISWWISVVFDTKVNNTTTGIQDSEGKTLLQSQISFRTGISQSEISSSGSGMIKVSKGEIIKLVNQTGISFRLSRENGYSGQMTINKVNGETYAFIKNKGNTDRVVQGGEIKMNSVDFSSNIMYKDGIITILEKGQYFVSWVGIIDTSEIIGSDLKFVLSLNKGGVQMLTSGIVGQVGLIKMQSQGVGIVELQQGDQVALFNMSDTYIDLTDSGDEVPVSLAIYKLG